MIGLIRLRSPHMANADTVELVRLPESPAPRYSGAIVHCSGDRELRRALAWYALVRGVRPLFTFGLVASPNLCMAPLASFVHPIAALATPDELVDRRVPLSMVDAVRGVSLGARILQELVDERGNDILKEQRLLATVISRATIGGTLASAAKDLGMSADTLRRRIRALGWEAAHLSSRVRVRAYEIRVAAGVPRQVALLAGGWTDPEARRKVARRVARRQV